MLEPAKPSDTGFFYGLYMHPAINPYLLYEPMTAAEFQPIFNDLLARSVLYILKVNDVGVGMCKLVPQTHRNAHTLYLGGVAIHPDYNGKGYGLQLMQEIINHAKATGIKRIELSTATYNLKAIRLYEKAGFEVEGRMRNYTWMKNENKYVDEFLMSWIG